MALCIATTLATTYAVLDAIIHAAGKLGYAELRPHQERTVKAFLSGKDRTNLLDAEQLLRKLF